MAHGESGARELLRHLPGHRLLVTGGSGFIGSAFIRHLLACAPDTVHVYNLDTLEYCAGVDAVLGGLALALETRTEEAAAVAALQARYHFIAGSILDAPLVLDVLRTNNIDILVHMAAQTHVDNSFSSSLLFTQVNVVGTHTLLECARQYGRLTRFLHISTDEVYGETSATARPSSEATTVLCPTNPYAATKAAAEHLVAAYHHSFQLPVLISRGNNVYGPGQYPEKVIPCFITHALRQERLPIHGDGHHQRSFLYVDDVARALCTILARGSVGEVYNVASEREWSVHEVARQIVACVTGAGEAAAAAAAASVALDAPRAVFDAAHVRYVADRAYNDARYCIDSGKLAALGWVQEMPFDEGLRHTVAWYRAQSAEAGEYWRGARAVSDTATAAAAAP